MERKNNKKTSQTQKKEENAVILDYLRNGYVNSDLSKFRGKPIAQAIGTDYFTLLELSPKEGIDLDIHDTVYIGKGKREKISRILGKLDYENLTATSRLEMEYVIRDVVEANEEKYVDFFNNADPLSTRLHKLELIPGIGKKHMWAIIEARKEKPFESFVDISERVPPLSDPVGMLVNRIKQELDTTTTKKGKKKYYLFTSIPRKLNNNKKIDM